MNREQLAAFSYWPQVITIAIVCIAFVSYRYFAYYDTRSNDAYVSANIINMAAQVAGPISRIYVVDNQPVKKGDKLVEIDARPYRYALNKTKALLKLAKINYENNKLAVLAAQQKVKQQEAVLALSHDHLRRYDYLKKQGAAPEIQVINVEAKIKEEEEAELMAAVQQLKIAEKNVDDSEIKAAQAAYDQAGYLYHHTLIRAPVTGYVTNFNLRVGQYIKVGQGVFAVVDSSSWWVITRYRETAVRLIKPGNKAKIYIDMYPGKVFYGHVDSIGWGINRVQAGDVASSTLAYLEATEDWIKIAQRFPVRIYFDEISPEFPLRIGASATTITYR